MAAKKKPTLAEAFKSAKDSSDSKKPDPSDKKPTSPADVRMAEEKINNKGTTWIPVAVAGIDANGKKIFQQLDETFAKNYIKGMPNTFQMRDGQLHAKVKDSDLQKLGLINERAIVKEKEDGTYDVKPGKLAYVIKFIGDVDYGFMPLSTGKDREYDLENIQLIKDSKVVKKIQSGDLPEIAQFIDQKDFILRTKPNMPKTQGAKEAYRRSAKRQIDNIEGMKEAMKGWVIQRRA